MMYGVIAALPSLLGYTFVLILVIILGFVVVYIAHKIYCWVYDYLPVAQITSTSQAKVDNESIDESLTQQHLSTKSTTSKSSYIEDKINTALRIFVNFEPCYLAYMIFEAGLSTDDSDEGLDPGPSPSDSEPTSKRLIKYYDRLSNIPTASVLKPCPTKSTTHNSSNNDMAQS